MEQVNNVQIAFVYYERLDPQDINQFYFNHLRMEI